MFKQYRRSLADKFETTTFLAGTWPRKHLGIIASQPGAGKTWYMLRLALDLSVGGTIFDSLAYNEPPAKSLILCGETGYEMLAERANMMNRPYNPDNISIYSAIDMAKVGKTMILDDPNGWSTIQNIVREENPDIMIMDTLISFRSDDENASKDTSKILGKLRALADNYNMSVILMHHTRKRNIRDKNLEGGQDEIIGSSALMRFASIGFLLDKFNGICSLRCVKSWWKQPEKFNYKISGTDGHTTVEAAYDWEDITQARMRATKYIHNMRGAFLTVNDVVKAVQVGYNTARRALQTEATNMGRIGDKGEEQFYVE